MDIQSLYDDSLATVQRLLNENESLRQELTEWEALKDANALYVNLLSGRPAQLSIDHKKGLLGQQLAEQTSSVPARIAIPDSPKKIYLNIGDTDFEEVKENGWSWTDLSEITWSEDSIDQCDIPYIRADLAATPPSVEVLVEALRLSESALQDALGKFSEHNELQHDAMQSIRNALATYSKPITAEDK